MYLIIKYACVWNRRMKKRKINKSSLKLYVTSWKHRIAKCASYSSTRRKDRSEREFFFFFPIQKSEFILPSSLNFYEKLVIIQKSSDFISRGKIKFFFFSSIDLEKRFSLPMTMKRMLLQTWWYLEVN